MYIERPNYRYKYQKVIYIYINKNISNKIMNSRNNWPCHEETMGTHHIPRQKINFIVPKQRRCIGCSK
jgi:hypothetical protein